MTLKEKISLMSGHGIFKYLLRDGGFGKRVYPGGGLKRLGIPEFKFTDGPRGVIIPGSTCFPVSMARGASWDLELEEKIGEAIGKEVRAHGGNLFGGVCVNLLRHPAWGRAQETYGEDPYHIGQFGAALVRGVQKHNVMATVKHFAANSIENSRFKVNVKMDERTLREVYLAQFKKCIDEGCATVMSAYNKLLGEYCGQNRYLLRTILKEEWNFQGFVHSDWFFGLHDTIAGIKGGLDVEMPRAKYYGKKLLKAAKENEELIELIDDSAKRIIQTVLKFTRRKDPMKYDKSLIACKEHVELAREAAEKSMVLLKNKNKILPLNVDKIRTLAIIGRLADLKNTGDRGSSHVRQKNIITPLQGIKNLIGDKIEVKYDDASNIEKAIEIASSSDIVITIVGYTYEDEGEYIKIIKEIGGDRDNLSLKEEDINLINSIAKVNQNCIVVLIGGSAIIMEEWKDNVAAILMAWYSGMQGGNALAKILFGIVNPSGKLPFTIPKDSSHLPFFKKDIDEITYDYFHGYTLLEKENIEPAFAFGFGLSYTSFKIENLRVHISGEVITSTVDVSNTGNKFGEEVVQLYIGLENSKIKRPKKLLKGFRKVKLNPGETKSVSIQINKMDLAWYNPKLKSWEVEPMIYKIYVGSSSRKEDLLTTSISIT